jgi:hypothetical protein
MQFGEDYWSQNPADQFKDSVSEDQRPVKRQQNAYKKPD